MEPRKDGPPAAGGRGHRAAGGRGHRAAGGRRQGCERTADRPRDDRRWAGRRPALGRETTGDRAPIRRVTGQQTTGDEAMGSRRGDRPQGGWGAASRSLPRRHRPTRGVRSRARGSAGRQLPFVGIGVRLGMGWPGAAQGAGEWESFSGRACPLRRYGRSPTDVTDDHHRMQATSEADSIHKLCVRLLMNDRATRFT
jgi:hypothetical protein